MNIFTKFNEIKKSVQKDILSVDWAMSVSLAYVVTLCTLQHRDGPLPMVEPLDPVERDIEFIPTKAPYDPRCMLQGCYDPDNAEHWLSGFFDNGSFLEIMEKWAQSVVVGRAR